MNNPDIAKYRIESTFIKNECIRSFYRRALEIPEYNIEQETIENILPKYESANVKFKTKDPITENIDDLKVIKDAIYTNTSISVSYTHLDVYKRQSNKTDSFLLGSRLFRIYVWREDWNRK